MNGDSVYFKSEFNFIDNSDKVSFFYSFDGADWLSLGDVHQLRYTLDHFMGCRIGLYSYCTKETGGYADFDNFVFKIDTD